MTTSGTDFIQRLERKVRQQLSSQRVGYLLGAGASYLDGNGYPLASQLWERLRDRLPDNIRRDIQGKLDDDADGLEHALDLLDRGGVEDSHHRHAVVDAIAQDFGGRTPPLDDHKEFIQRISARSELGVPIFCLNYDPLLERASDEVRVRLFDGFAGFEGAYFAPETFQQKMGVEQRGPRYRQPNWIRGVVHLYKLHGSLGWFIDTATGIRRRAFDSDVPDGSRRLMVPPQYRKATDTTTPPYSDLWSEFRRCVRHGPDPLNRLACIGYGMRDEHVNAVLDNGLARSNFTMMVFSRSLSDAVFGRWSPRGNVILVTRNRCSLYGEEGEGHTDLWSFERLSREV